MKRRESRSRKPSNKLTWCRGTAHLAVLAGPSAAGTGALHAELSAGRGDGRAGQRTGAAQIVRPEVVQRQLDGGHRGQRRAAAVGHVVDVDRFVGHGPVRLGLDVVRRRQLPSRALPVRIGRLLDGPAGDGACHVNTKAPSNFPTQHAPFVPRPQTNHVRQRNRNQRRFSSETDARNLAPTIPPARPSRCKRRRTFISLPIFARSPSSKSRRFQP